MKLSYVKFIQGRAGISEIEYCFVPQFKTSPPSREERIATTTGDFEKLEGILDKNLEGLDLKKEEQWETSHDKLLLGYRYSKKDFMRPVGIDFSFYIPDTKLISTISVLTKEISGNKEPMFGIYDNITHIEGLDLGGQSILAIAAIDSLRTRSKETLKEIVTRILP